MDLKAPRSFWNPLGKAVPGKCHGFGGHNKSNDLQDEPVFTGLGHAKVSESLTLEKLNLIYIYTSILLGYTAITSKSVFRIAPGFNKILFTLYITPLGATTRKYQLNFHLYADNTHLYLAFKPNNTKSLYQTIGSIQNCVIDLRSWMAANMIQLNMDKTEILVLMTKSPRNPIIINKIETDSIVIW